MKSTTDMEEKLSAYIDLELTQQEMQQVSIHLENCDDSRKLYEELLALKTKMGQVQLPRLEEQEIMQIMNDKPATSLQSLGWIALAIGFVGLVMMHWIHMWQDNAIATTVKVLICLVEAGSLLIFAGVLRQRLIARKTDRYKDVQL